MAATHVLLAVRKVSAGHDKQVVACPAHVAQPAAQAAHTPGDAKK